MRTKHKTGYAVLTDLFNETVIALDQLVVRSPLQNLAQNGKCTCLQYEDNDDCRHLQALNALEAAKAYQNRPKKRNKAIHVYK